MSENNTFYIKFYEEKDERLSITIYSGSSDQEGEKLYLGVFNILYRDVAGFLYNFNVVKVNIDDDDRYFLVKQETKKSVKEVARILHDFFVLMTDKD